MRGVNSDEVRASTTTKVNQPSLGTIYRGAPEAVAPVAMYCGRQESPDPQHGWRHPVPALMTQRIWRRVQAGFHTSSVKAVYTTCSCVPHVLSHSYNTWLVTFT